jgi:hypothetical protein
METPKGAGVKSINVTARKGACCSFNSLEHRKALTRKIFLVELCKECNF